ncbi:DUF2326 domain-containing protein [Faecalibacillus intestinalis]|uniref:DUF2326 domain-containing protein n=1 Tax=Faecalibacillus intestinalis TaxID=1982626 RepID=UPI0035230580
MYLKQLLVIKNGVILRNINFHKGLNLIIDETKEEGSTTTGNNVGKTTVLKLIYFCFGGDPKEIYTSTENAKDEYPLIKEFLTNNNVEVRLTLKEDLNVVDSKEIVIERNFLKRSKSYRKINGEKYTEKEFTKELRSLIFNDLESDKPTLKQLVGHNIRYKDSAISNTIKYLAPYTKDVEYEALYLYLLGCSHKKGQKKEELLTKLKQEEKFKRRLELSATKNDYAIMLAAVNNNIETLDKKRSNLNINENFEEDLNTLNRIKSDINQLSEGISLLEIRKDLINESKNELEKNNVDIDLVELKLIYEEVSENLSDLNKTFSDLVNYHNTMINNKVKYITKELPLIESKINSYNEQLTKLLDDEKEYTALLKKSDTFEDLESIIKELNSEYQKKGEYEAVIVRIEESEKQIKIIENNISDINNEIMSEEYQQDVKKQVTEFNKYFEEVSQYLYGEKYLLSYNIKKNKNNQSYYNFITFNENLSSGKKQGEILCFDIALIMFSRSRGLSHLSFVLNDKKELMDNHQLLKVANYAKKNGIQLVFSMLADKVPDNLNNDENIVLSLSQKSKLFKIEE